MAIPSYNSVSQHYNAIIQAAMDGDGGFDLRAQTTAIEKDQVDLWMDQLHAMHVCHHPEITLTTRVFYDANNPERMLEQFPEFFFDGNEIHTDGLHALDLPDQDELGIIFIHNLEMGDSMANNFWADVIRNRRFALKEFSYHTTFIFI